MMCQLAGNPWTIAAILTVKRGRPLNPAGGGSSASVPPSIPSSFQAALDRVGPRSGPPCFLEPPTRVGAILLARLAQSFAPSQPFDPISSTRSSPTVGGGLMDGSGQAKAS